MPDPAIKICGLTTPEAVEAALAGRATHLGFIFFPPSPRDIAPEAAARLAEAARGRAEVVAVTVNADDATQDAIVAALRPDWLQLHGKEPPERVAELKARHGCKVMKAFSVSTPADLEALAPWRPVADRFLFDAKPPKDSTLPGGNGVSFDWSLLAGYGAEDEAAGLSPFMLSGGIHDGNVAEALAQSGARALDVSSGVESAPGVKDPARIREFLAAAREAMMTPATPTRRTA